jgi:hypothetical protein
MSMSMSMNKWLSAIWQNDLFRLTLCFERGSKEFRCGYTELQHLHVVSGGDIGYNYGCSGPSDGSGYTYGRW